MTFGKLGTTFRGETKADMERHVNEIEPRLMAALSLKTEGERYQALDALHASASHNQRMVLVEIMMRVMAAGSGPENTSVSERE
ncbi:hypothetical protein [Taklimakanibacter deserti]|uniref:hypothetical protein n=1 Tax=Taklimakanibacter deserti TaxID=2267839 RepID=UPI000E64C3FF